MPRRKTTRDAEGSILKKIVERRTDRGRLKKDTIYFARVRMNEYDSAGAFVRQHSRKRTCYSHEEAVTVRRELRGEIEAEIAKAQRKIPDDIKRLFDLIDFFQKEYVKEAIFAGGKRIGGQKDPVRHTVRMLDSFRSFFGNVLLIDLDYPLIHEYKKYLTEEAFSVRRKVLLGPDEKWTGETVLRNRQRFKIIHEARYRKPATVHRYLAKLRRVLSIGVQHRYLATNPFKHGDPLIETTIEEVRDRICDYREEARLYDVCTGPRRHLGNIITVAIDTFARENELFSLIGSDVNFDGRYITIREVNAKTSSRREVPLTDRAVTAFLEMKGDRSEAEWSISRVIDVQSVSKSWYTALAKAGIEDLRFHDLRGTGITRMLDAGVPAPIVMNFSGHKKFETFKKYVKKDRQIMNDAGRALSDLTRSRQNEDLRGQWTLDTHGDMSQTVIQEIEIEGDIVS
jgi:integrase